MSNTKKYWGILTYSGGREQSVYGDFQAQVKGIFKRSNALTLQIFGRKKPQGWEAIETVVKDRVLPRKGETQADFNRLKWTAQ